MSIILSVCKVQHMSALCPLKSSCVRKGFGLSEGASLDHRALSKGPTECDPFSQLAPDDRSRSSLQNVCLSCTWIRHVVSNLRCICECFPVYRVLYFFSLYIFKFKYLSPYFMSFLVWLVRTWKRLPVTIEEGCDPLCNSEVCWQQPYCCRLHWCHTWQQENVQYFVLNKTVDVGTCL